MNIRLFPFDSQLCTYQFGSWSYPGHDLILEDKRQYGELQDLTKNIEWDVYDMPLYSHNVTYACCPDDFYPVLGEIIFN